MRAMIVGVMVALGLGVGGCKKDQASTTVPAGESSATEAPTLTIRVRAEDDGNAKRPFYTVVRTVVLKDFVEDQYEDIVGLVVAPDETVLASFLVFPGRSAEVVIAKPEGAVGVYCLLTEANGTSWKRLFEAPEEIAVVVGRDQLVESQ